MSDIDAQLHDEQFSKADREALARHLAECDHCMEGFWIDPRGSQHRSYSCSIRHEVRDEKARIAEDQAKREAGEA